MTFVTFSPDGARVASCSYDNSVGNAATGEIEPILEGHSDKVTSVGFSPDGTCVAIWCISPNMEYGHGRDHSEFGIECILRRRFVDVTSFSSDGITIQSEFGMELQGR